jgi:hypothetical protein
MTRKTWIIVLVAGGIGLAILIGVLGTRNEPSNSTTKAQAVNTFCASLTGLGSSLKTLTSLDPSSATKDELNTDVNAVQSSWTQVQSAAQGVQNASMGSLDSAWNSFESAVKNIPNASSVSDATTSVQQAGQQLESTAKSTAASINCT